MNPFFRVLLVMTLATNSTFGQIAITKTNHDFGNVSASSNRTVDFFIVNNQKFAIILSSFLIDFELSTSYAPISVEPGDTLQYQVKIMPNKKGPFQKTIPISFYHLSDTIFIEVKANVLTTDFDDKSYLKPLTDKPGKYDEEFKLFDAEFRVIDAATGKPIPDASLSFSAKSPSYKALTTDKNGIAKRQLSNRYNVSIYAPGYKTAKLGISLGCNDSIRTVQLRKKGPNEKSDYEYQYAYEGENPIKMDDTLTNLDALAEQKLLEPLEKGNYKPNNIVFLMDVSISMKDHNRMQLLKSAIVNLVQLMRPEDNISVITFSENTHTLVPPTALSSTNRDQVIEIINELEAAGLTNGGKGLKLAFKLIRENFDATKNNQIILATDGALGSYMKHTDMVELVEKNASYASTSVVTLNGYNWTGTFMREIVRAGNGKLLPINNETEAKLMLIREIKANSILLTE